MLKADLHLHTKEDPHDKLIKYNAKQLIDYASELGFKVLSITLHWFPGTSDRMFYNKDIAGYAKKRGILLIPGVEARIKVNRFLRKDILLYNFTNKELKQIKTLDDVRRIKQRHHLVIAPHPFFLHFKLVSLGGKLLKRYIDIFDAIEHHPAYNVGINFNRKAIEIAAKYNKPLVGNSDAHNLGSINTNYSLIRADQTIDSVIKAIKNRGVELKTRPLSAKEIAERALLVFRELIYP